MAACEVAYGAIAFSPLIQNVEVRDGETTTVYIDLKIWQVDGAPPSLPVVPLSGVVLDEAGHPIQGATIIERERLHGDMSTASDADGRFGFCDVRLGKVTLLVKRAGYINRSIRLTVGIDASQPLEIRLRKR